MNFDNNYYPKIEDENSQSQYFDTNDHFQQKQDAHQDQEENRNEDSYYQQCLPNQAHQIERIFDQEAQFDVSTNSFSIDGQTVLQIFQKTGLDNETLARIWSEVNQEDAPVLTKDQFLEATNKVNEILVSLVQKQDEKKRQNDQETTVHGYQKTGSIVNNLGNNFHHHQKKFNNNLNNKFDPMEETMVTQTRCQLDAQIVDVCTEEETKNFGLRKTTYHLYVIKTQSSLPKFNKNEVYEVKRRYNDFKKFFMMISSVEKYKGFSIPPLPVEQASLSDRLVQHSQEFINQRKQGLQNFLRVITAHETIMFDDMLFKFLTEEELDDSFDNPKMYAQAMHAMEKYPFLKDIATYDYDFLCTLVKFQMTLTKEEEVASLLPFEKVKGHDGREVKTKVNLEQRQTEIQYNLHILQKVLHCLQVQKKISENQAGCTARIGMLLQNIKNVDQLNQEPENSKVISEQTTLKQSINLSKSGTQTEYEVVKQEALDTLIRDKFEKVSTFMNLVQPTQGNVDLVEPNHRCEIYLLEKIAQLQGLVNAINERNIQAKGYMFKLALLGLKKQNLEENTHAVVCAKLTQEIEELNKLLEVDKKIIHEQNLRILTDDSKLDKERGLQIKKLLINYGKSSAEVYLNLLGIFSQFEKRDQEEMTYTNLDSSQII